MENKNSSGSNSKNPTRHTGKAPSGQAPNRAAGKMIPGKRRPSPELRQGTAEGTERQKNSRVPAGKHRPAEKTQPKPPVKRPDPSTAGNTPLHSGYRKETDEEIRSKPPTGTPEYPYYKGSFASARVRRHPGLRNAFSILITTIMSLFLICIITGTIVETTLTIYIMDFSD